jgi:hypothetical protein
MYLRNLDSKRKGPEAFNHLRAFRNRMNEEVKTGLAHDYWRPNLRLDFGSSRAALFLWSFTFGRLEARHGSHKLAQAGRIEIDGCPILITIHNGPIAVLDVVHVLPDFKSH